jgi:threonine aldolase
MIIDLRSDTLTKPSKEMMTAIQNANVGDDVYGEDPTVNHLQEYVADLLGKEAAIFIPSGTMSNQLGVKANTSAGDEVIIENDAHIYFFETAAPSIISNVQLRPIPSEFGEIPIEDIANAIRPDIYYFPRTTLICLENTHNRHGGSILSVNYFDKVNKLVDGKNIALHLDGARIWNASIATGISVKKYVEHFDTVSVCLSKGLGAPVGSVLVGSKEKISIAHRWRKILGGGMRQAGILAAAGLYAVKNNISRLEEDHSNAKYFAKQITNIDELEVDFNNVQTNMVAIKTLTMSAAELVQRCKISGLLFNSIDKNRVRIVFHLNISKNDTANAIEIMKSVFVK